MKQKPKSPCAAIISLRRKSKEPLRQTLTGYLIAWTIPVLRSYDHRSRDHAIEIIAFWQSGCESFEARSRLQ
jgi:hypothetical protein